jgi:hypothetical protein
MLDEKLKKVMAGKKDMPSHEKEAKMSVVKHLRDMAVGAMKDKMHPKHQVSVASNSPEGLQAGLDVAQKVAGQDSDDSSAPAMAHGGEVDPVDGNEPASQTDDAEEAQMLHDAENPEHDALSAHEEHDPDEDMDEDELNAKLEKLMKMKDGKKSQKSNQPY